MEHQIHGIEGGKGGRNNPGVQLGRRGSGLRPETPDSRLISPPNAIAGRSPVSAGSTSRRSPPLFSSPRGRARRDQASNLVRKSRRRSLSTNPSFNRRSAASRSLKESRRSSVRRLLPCPALFPPTKGCGRPIPPLEMQGEGRLRVSSPPQAFSHRFQASPFAASRFNQPPEPCLTSPAVNPVLVHYEEEFPPLVASQPNPLREGSITPNNHSRSMPVPPLITPAFAVPLPASEERETKEKVRNSGR